MSSKVLRVILSCDKLTSVNNRLWGSKNKGMRHSWDYEHEQQQLFQELDNQQIPKNCLDPKKLYSFTYVFYFKQNIERRDTDNFLKCVTDVLSKHLGFNDNKIVSYKISKRQLIDFGENPQKEYVLVEIEEVDGWWDKLKIKFDDFKEFVRRYIESAGT